jgi:hypothetical protein
MCGSNLQFVTDFRTFTMLELHETIRREKEGYFRTPVPHQERLLSTQGITDTKLRLGLARLS